MLDLQVFANRLKAARTQKNMSQADLAKAVGVATGTISVYENPSGGRYPALDKTIAIAETLEVSVDWLCGRENKSAVEQGGLALLKELLAIIEKLDLSVDTASRSGFVSTFIGVPASNTELIGFFKEYKKIEPILQDNTIDDYLKKGLKKALFEKFSKATFDEDYPF